MDKPLADHVNRIIIQAKPRPNMQRIFGRDMFLIAGLASIVAADLHLAAKATERLFQCSEKSEQ